MWPVIVSAALKGFKVRLDLTQQPRRHNHRLADGAGDGDDEGGSDT
jgi:hypothetical protein